MVPNWRPGPVGRAAASIRRVTDLALLRTSLLAALGVAACSSSRPGEGAVEVDVPTPGSAVVPVGTARRPPRSPVGYVTEADGTIHRAGAITCDTAIEQAACRGDEGHRSCTTDAECTAGPNGKCVTGNGQIGPYCDCVYACATDADCKAEEACVCKEQSRLGHATCAPATCRVDADCESGRCGVSAYHNGCGIEVAQACRSSADQCASDADCTGSKCRVQRRGEGAPVWDCQRSVCMIGRPLLVDGAARRAAVAARADWSDGALAAALAASSAQLDPSVRERVGRHHAAIAALEHASVASFARASLELLALGAPPDLLHDTHAAAADEIRHARLTYAVARAHGVEVGPGRLDLGGVLDADVEPARVARAVAHEGCVGETLGAAEARAAADACVDPALRGALGSIADDELAHAALAWRTLAWLIATFGDVARAAAEEGLDAALASLVPGADEVSPAADDPELEAALRDRGVLLASEVAALRRAVARDVVAACRATVGATTPRGA